MARPIDHEARRVKLLTKVEAVHAQIVKSLDRLSSLLLAEAGGAAKPAKTKPALPAGAIVAKRRGRPPKNGAAHVAS